MSLDVSGRFLFGFAFPPLWYYATVLYFGNYYLKDPRERPGLAASAIAVSIEMIFITLLVFSCLCSSNYMMHIILLFLTCF